MDLVVEVCVADVASCESNTKTRRDQNPGQQTSAAPQANGVQIQAQLDGLLRMAVMVQVLVGERRRTTAGVHGEPMRPVLGQRPCHQPRNNVQDHSDHLTKTLPWKPACLP